MRNLFIALLLIAAPMQSFAQAGTTEVGAAVAFPFFDTDDLRAGDLEASIDGETGYGLTLNHFWTRRFSTELSWYAVRGEFSIPDEALALQVLGDVELKVLSATAQFHFLPDARIDPYAGGGIALVSGGFDALEADHPGDDFERETTFVANAGIAVNLTERLSIAGDIKYVPYDARPEDVPEAESVAIDPTIVSINFRLRF